MDTVSDFNGIIKITYNNMKNSKMKILITGTAGKVGRAIYINLMKNHLVIDFFRCQLMNNLDFTKQLHKNNNK